MFLPGGRKGFTLIELLVVIAIISILASILFPVFSRAQGKGRQAACISNAKQIALALIMYAQDYDEVLPRGQAAAGDPESQWYNAIFPYTRNRQIMFCPDRKDKAPGYAMNYMASGMSLGSFWDPSTKIIVGDVRPEAIGAAAPWHTGADGDWYINDMNNAVCGAPDDNSFTGNNWPQRHNEGTVYGFVDGHVKWARESQVNQRVYWDPMQPSE
ncbi:MAG: prepilin-type N-terminal cleavage/methylation domain-containing protein [candidate division WS1 bacterium]|jgi:prepilin-type N-terminal cleavage/methylation domain-containing protein/prepilin-type processing-associated H-X9-DG protein|nr:prepilin-type N-terminal cleavage/methylation domain-containing protein [candidate division WS1 bacterium]